MGKFAMIIHVPNESEDTYSKVYSNHGAHELYAGVSDNEMAIELLKRLFDEGYNHINLCGYFDEDTLNIMRKMAGPDVKIQGAKYLPSEEKKLNLITSFNECGFISYVEEVTEPEYLALLSENGNTYVSFVNSLEMACEEVKRFEEKGIYLVDLCGWFDLYKTQEIIACAGSSIPVGSCGL